LARFCAKHAIPASPLKKLHLMFAPPDRLLKSMRIADVSAFYTPLGGGVRTYVEAKLRAAARYGHELIVIAPGEDHQVIKRGPGAFLVTIPSPKLPVDRRYRYFDDERMLHATLDAWQPDHVEASSPWSSATMVGRWQGSATRSLVMHADPLAAYAYRWLGGIAPTTAIDRWFGWFWGHLRGLGRMFDTVVCANSQLAERLAVGGVANTETIQMGVEPGLFSPSLRSAELRRAALAALGLGPEALLLLGIGRFSAEKRWEVVLRAAGECGRKLPVGLLLVGHGSKRQKLEMISHQYRNIELLPQIADRVQLASLLASVDALVHGCEAETFCLVAAEARASGIPLIIPDRGAALDQLVEGAGTTFTAGRERSLEQAIARFINRGPELQRAAAVRASAPRTMDEHFADLFARYQALAPERSAQPVGRTVAAGAAVPQLEPVPEVSLARSGTRLG
jgi:alpha-1,6-mannosyltransferase